MPRMWPCERLSTIDSTQQELHRRLPALTGPTAIWTTRQTAGIASHGRSWQDSPDGFAWSVAWPAGQQAPERAAWPARLSLMTLGVLEACCPEIEACIGLKWPNDLMARPLAKLGGVLVSSHRVLSENWLIAGIGINLSWPVKAQIDRPVADLKSLGARVEPEHLAQGLCAAISALWSGAVAGQEWATEFSRRDLLLGQRVEVVHPHSAEVMHTGVHHGVDAQGRLLLLSQGQVMPIGIGELSLRMHEETT